MRCAGSSRFRARPPDYGGEPLQPIARAVIRHHPLSFYAMAGEPGQGAFEEGAGVILVLARPRGVIDAHMQIVPALAGAAVRAETASGHRMAGQGKPAQLLDVQMDQLSSPGLARS